MNSLIRSLQDYPLAMLRAIADLRGVALRSNVARLAVEQLAEALVDPDNLLAALAGCSPQARAALDVLLRNGGRSPASTFERRFGTIRRLGPGRLEREAPQRHPANPAEELWYRGLIFRAFAQTSAGPAEFLYVASDILPLLPQPQPLAAAFDLNPADAPDHVFAGHDEVLHDVCSLLCLVQSGAVRLSEPDNPLAWRSTSLADLNRVLLQPASSPALLTDPDAGVPGALVLILAAELGWLRARRYRLQLAAGPVRHWLEARRGEQRRALLEAWRQSPGWNDLCRTPTLHCEQTGSWANDPVGTRDRFLPLLASLAADQWYAVDDLVAAVKEYQPDFQRPDGDYSTWYIRRRGEQTYLRGFECWDQVEGQLVRFLLAGPLAWLGAVLNGGNHSQGSEDGSPSTDRFRLTPAGAAWLTERPAPDEPDTGQIVVEGDFTVIVPLDVPLLDRFRVARFTTWLDSGPPFRYRITQSGLRRAVGQGIDVERILAFLSERTGDSLPANVLAALKRWHAP